MARTRSLGAVRSSRPTSSAQAATRCSQLSRTSSSVIRLDADPTLPFLHPFVIFEAEQTVITVETYTAELSIREPADIATYRQYLDRLRSMALWADTAAREIQTML